MSVDAPSRRRSRQVRVGRILVGGDAPVMVQSMTNTDTADAEGTAQQVLDLARAGSEVVRVTVNTIEAAQAIPEIRSRLDAAGCDVPLVGDFHFNGHRLLTQVPECARVLERMAKLGMNLEIELGVTGGEEDGIGGEFDESADNAKLYTQPEDVLYAYDVLNPIGRFSVAASFGNVQRPEIFATRWRSSKLPSSP